MQKEAIFITKWKTITINIKNIFFHLDFLPVYPTSVVVWWECVYQQMRIIQIT